MMMMIATTCAKSTVNHTVRQHVCKSDSVYGMHILLRSANCTATVSPQVSESTLVCHAIKLTNNHCYCLFVSHHIPGW
jgi:hypothetical protein